MLSNKTKNFNVCAWVCVYVWACVFVCVCVRTCVFSYRVCAEVASASSWEILSLHPFQFADCPFPMLAVSLFLSLPLDLSLPLSLSLPLYSSPLSLSLSVCQSGSVEKRLGVASLSLLLNLRHGPEVMPQPSRSSWSKSKKNKHKSEQKHTQHTHTHTPHTVAIMSGHRGHGKVSIASKEKSPRELA